MTTRHGGRLPLPGDPPGHPVVRACFFFSSSLTLGPIKSVSRLICLWISFLANLATLLLCYLRRVDALEESSELDRSLQNSSLKSIPLLISIEIQSFMPALIFVRHYGLT